MYGGDPPSSLTDEFPATYISLFYTPLQLGGQQSLYASAFLSRHCRLSSIWSVTSDALADTPIGRLFVTPNRAPDSREKIRPSCPPARNRRYTYGLLRVSPISPSTTTGMSMSATLIRSDGLLQVWLRPPLCAAGNCFLLPPIAIPGADASCFFPFRRVGVTAAHPVRRPGTRMGWYLPSTTRTFSVAELHCYRLPTKPSVRPIYLPHPRYISAQWRI